MAKLRGWQITGIKIVALPLLRRLSDAAVKAAAKTETQVDDALAGAFQMTVEGLEDDAIFNELIQET